MDWTDFFWELHWASSYKPKHQFEKKKNFEKNFEIGLATVVLKKGLGICTDLAIPSGRVCAYMYMQSFITLALKL